MLCQVLQLEVPLVNALSRCIISREGQANHKLLLQSQILQIAIEDPSKVVNSFAFHGQVEHDVRHVYVGAQIDLLGQDCFRAFLDVTIWRVTVHEPRINLCYDSVLPPAILDASVYPTKNQRVKIKSQSNV